MNCTKTLKESEAIAPVKIEIAITKRQSVEPWFSGIICMTIQGKVLQTTRSGIDPQDVLEKALMYLSTVNINEP